MAYRARKLHGNGRGHHCPGYRSPRSHSPRVSGSKLMRLPRPVRAAERPMLVSRDVDSLPPLNECDLITQIYASQRDLPLREFASYFNGRTQHNVPPCLTSHAGSNRLLPVMPLYNTFRPSVTWDINQKELHRTQKHGYNCRCFDCSNARCQAEANMNSCNRNFRFKNNIIQFCDQQTMTSKVNDVSCGICLGVGRIQEKGVEVSTSGSKPDTQKTFCRPNEPACSRIAPMVRPVSRNGQPRGERRKTVVTDEYDDVDCWPEKCFNEQDEAVRDTDSPVVCYEQGEQPMASRNPPNTAEERIRCFPHVLEYNTCPMRKMLYNEGISDEIANNLPTCIREVTSPSQTQESYSNDSLDWRCCETETWIPYSHKSTSKYHSGCKKPVDQRYRCETDGEIYQTVQDYTRKGVKKIFYTKPLDSAVAPPCFGMSLPRKVLASEKNIDMFICKGRSFDYNNDCNEDSCCDGGRGSAAAPAAGESP